MTDNKTETEVKQTTLDEIKPNDSISGNEEVVKPSILPCKNTIKKQRMLSPSQINTFRQCPRKWYYSYIEKLPSFPSIHLLRGSAVHSAIEEISKLKALPNKTWKARLKSAAMNKLNDKWKSVDKLKGMTDEEKKKFYDESVMMIEAYLQNLYFRIETTLISGKAKAPTHAWHLIKPKFSEIYLKDDKLKVRGIIDEVHKDFSDNVYLLDLKTSNKYRMQISDDYKLQLAIYAYLYKEDTGKAPTYVAIQYLKYNETYFIPVNRSLIDWAKAQIQTMRFFIEKWEDDKSQYYKTESKLCDWCDYYDTCKVD